MTNGPFSLRGLYFDGRQPVAAPATIDITGNTVRFSASEVEHSWRLSELHVSPRIAKAERFIELPDGGQFQCPDSPQLDALPQEVSEGLVAWLESRVVVALLAIVAVLVAVIAGYFYGLPRLADAAAARIPVEAEAVLGQAGLTWLDENEWLQPTKLDSNRRMEIQQVFDRLHAELPPDTPYRLEFRFSPKFGANAFALPGGTIVVTDEMVDLARSRDELAAVLAHEIGHIARRHTLRLLLQNSAVVVVAATIIGDVTTLGAAAAPALLAQARYSREFEGQADDFAFDLLRRHGISPESFARIMLRMDAQHRPSKTSNPHSFLSSHPLTAERIARARAAAQGDGAVPENFPVDTPKIRGLP